MIEELVKRYPVLESVKGQIEDAYKRHAMRTEESF